MAILLKYNIKLFFWIVVELLNIDPSITFHKLSTFKEARPMTQMKRKVGEEKRKTAKVEVDKLLQVGFIQEACYTTWLMNIVLVCKSNNK